jgi:hypothetical protein
MQLIFIYGQVASGKLTVARELAARTGVALFHNHLVVDAVGAVFPFGTETFSRLREQFWMTVFDEAAKHGRSLIFTFAPEPTVARDFPDRVRAIIESRGGEVIFVHFTYHVMSRSDALSTKVGPRLEKCVICRFYVLFDLSLTRA